MTQDLWLLAGIVAFYLYDAAMLLYANELVAWPRRRGWAAAVGGDTQWRGAFAFLPAWWRPASPVLRLQWMRAPGTGATGLDVQPLLRALRPLQVGVWLMAALLFLVLPLLLWGWRHWQGLLVLLVAIYLLSTGMIVYVARRRAVLGLSRRAVTALAIDALACPPFALNLVRKIGLRQSLGVDGLDFITARLTPEALQRLSPRLIARLDILLLAEAQGSARAHELHEVRDRLEKMTHEQD